MLFSMQIKLETSTFSILMIVIFTYKQWTINCRTIMKREAMRKNHQLQCFNDFWISSCCVNLDNNLELKRILTSFITTFFFCINFFYYNVVALIEYWICEWKLIQSKSFFSQTRTGIKSMHYPQYLRLLMI